MQVRQASIHHEVGRHFRKKEKQAFWQAELRFLNAWPKQESGGKAHAPATIYSSPRKEEVSDKTGKTEPTWDTGLKKRGGCIKKPKGANECER